MINFAIWCVWNRHFSLWRKTDLEVQQFTFTYIRDEFGVGLLGCWANWQ